MKKVIFRGPSLTQSGYGVHCRQIAEWLLSKSNIDVKFQVLPWGDTPWILKQDLYNNLIEKITSRAIDPAGSKFDVSLQLQLPNEWDPGLASFNVGMTAGIETDRCNPAWVECCNRMDMVIVPSTHAEKSLKLYSEIKKPVFVIPESYCDSILACDTSSEPLLQFSTDFNFLVFGQITGDNPLNDRKNIFFTIKWLCEAFKDDKNVGIVIKTNLGKNTQIDKKRTQNLLKSIVKECRQGEFPKIHLLHGDMKEEEVSSLYRHPQIKALVSLTRGEGYGLPILEAAASGLPVIATGWSGHLDFLKPGKFIEISYNLQEIHGSRVDNRIFVKGAKWAEVVEEDFKKKIKKFRNSDSIPREWAKSLSIEVREKYSKASVFGLYEKVLECCL